MLVPLLVEDNFSNPVSSLLVRSLFLLLIGVDFFRI